MQFANINESVLLLVFDQVELETMRFLLDVIVWLLQILVQLLILVSSILLFLEYLAMILILVGHLLSFFLQLQKLSIFLFNVALGLGNVLLKFGVQVNEHIFPVKQVFLTIGKHLMVSFDLTRETFGHISEFPLMCSVRCEELVIKYAFHFHLLCVRLIVEILLLFRRIVEVIVISRGFFLNHCLQLIYLLHQFFVQLFQLIPFSNRVFELLRHRVKIIFALLDNCIDLKAGNHLSIFVRLLKSPVLFLQFLVHNQLVSHLCLQI